MEDLKSVEIQSAKGVLNSARDTYDRVIREVHKQKTIEGISRSIEESGAGVYSQSSSGSECVYYSISGEIEQAYDQISLNLL